MTVDRVTLLGHDLLGGRSDGLQVVGSGRRVFVAHLFSDGFTEVDIADPRRPRVLSFTPAPPGSWSIHLQVAGDLLLAVNGPDLWRRGAHVPGMSAPELQQAPGQSGVRVFDVAQPGRPREIGWLDIGGSGAHRLWYAGGDTAYVSAAPPGFDDTILLVLDVSDPARPREQARWSFPEPVAGGRRLSLHHAIEGDDHLLFGAWRDGGLTVHRLVGRESDRRGRGPDRLRRDGGRARRGPATEAGAAAVPQLLAHLMWDGPDGGGPAVHSTVPVPGRHLLAVVEEGVEEDGEPQRRRVRLLDIGDPADPVLLSRLPEPGVAPVAGARFGPHNLYEYRPGGWADTTVAFVAHQGAGLRVYDITDPLDPAQTAAFRPGPPERLIDRRPGRAAVAQTNDVFVSADGIASVVDTNLGLHTLALG
jgi:hypothetical protein